MDGYNTALNQYRITLKIVAGCGDRADDCIDRAYQALSTAHAHLTQDEKDANPLPQKEKGVDDDSTGIASGLAQFGQEEGCIIQ